MAAPDVPMALVYSARTVADIIFRDELIAHAGDGPDLALYPTVTRERPADAIIRSGRIDGALVGEVLARLGGAPRRTYACGSNAFVDASTRLLLDMGVPFETIRTERYGGEPAGISVGTALPEE